MKMVKQFVQFVVVGALAVGIVACGGETASTSSSDTETTAAETPKEETTTEPETPAEPEAAEEASNPWSVIKTEDVTATLSMTASGETMAEMAYTPAVIEAEAYSYVQLDFANETVADGMNHNVVILPNDPAVADAIRATAKGPDFNPTPDDRIIARTDMMLPGHKTSIGFETPEAGEYLIICTFPGHQKMQAKLIVK